MGEGGKGWTYFWRFIKETESWKLSNSSKARFRLWKRNNDRKTKRTIVLVKFLVPSALCILELLGGQLYNGVHGVHVFPWLSWEPILPHHQSGKGLVLRLLKLRHGVNQNDSNMHATCSYVELLFCGPMLFYVKRTFSSGSWAQVCPLLLKILFVSYFFFLFRFSRRSRKLWEFLSIFFSWWVFYRSMGYEFLWFWGKLFFAVNSEFLVLTDFFGNFLDLYLFIFRILCDFGGIFEFFELTILNFWAFVFSWVIFLLDWILYVFFLVLSQWRMLYDFLVSL